MATKATILTKRDELRAKLAELVDLEGLADRVIQAMDELGVDTIDDSKVQDILNYTCD